MHGSDRSRAHPPPSVRACDEVSACTLTAQLEARPPPAARCALERRRAARRWGADMSGDGHKAVTAAVAYGACVALSLALCARIAFALSSLQDALWTVAALFAGWLGADFVGAIYHWYMDNYAQRPNGFLRHHSD